MRRLVGVVGLGLAACGGASDPCSVLTGESGEVILSCTDGTSTVLEPGQNGSRGQSGRDGFAFQGKLEGDLNLLYRVDCEALAGVTEITGDVRLFGISPCEDFTLPKLKRVGGDLIFDSVQGAQSITLPELTEVGGQVYIGSPSDLLSIDLSKLTSVGASVPIETSPFTDRSLLIEYAPELEAIHLDALTDVAGGLGLWNLPKVTSLTSLAHLQSVHDILTMNDLDELTDLDLSALTDMGPDFQIFNNANLCDSKVTAIVDALQALGWSGTPDTSSNKSGC